MPRKPAQNVPHPHTPLAAIFMVLIVALLTVGLLLIWRELPTGSRFTPPATRDIPTVPAIPGSPEQAACEAADGTWIECGLPAGCKAGDVCAQVCVPQCLEKSVPKPPATTPVRKRPSGFLCDDLHFICVDEEVKDSTLTSPFIVKGSGIAFENTISWRLLDANGAVLEKGFVTADAPDIGQAGDFEIRAFLLNVPTTSTGTLEFFESSAKDGAPIHVVNIPVRLPRTTMNIRVYKSSMDLKDCSLVFPVEMVVPRSSLPVETSLRALLTDAVGISRDTRLVSLNVSGGNATAVFSPELQNYGGGSCNAQMIRSQIEQTLKQFSSVKDVVISVIGKTPAETLQP